MKACPFWQAVVEISNALRSYYGNNNNNDALAMQLNGPVLLFETSARMTSPRAFCTPNIARTLPEYCR